MDDFMKKKQKRIITILGIAIIILLGYMIYIGATGNKNNSNSNGNNDNTNEQNNNNNNDNGNGNVQEEKKLGIVDEDSTSRPYAVMINNNHVAWPHAGLQDAYITYEIIVEGGITRLMALFKDQETAKIGSVRSSRHYFLDYALENDAIYTHFGWSPKAESDISALGVNNINGLVDNAFWRDTTLDVAYEHTAFTNMEKMVDVAKKKGFIRKTNKDLLLNYSIDEINLEEKENSQIANSVYIKYSNYHNTSYEYDNTNKVYKRTMSGVKHVDAITKKQYTVKNIIVAKVKNTIMDSYGRQDLKNIGSGEGYFITNGYAVPITWSKSSRNSQTIYKYLNGEEIVVNDGNTYIQIQPIDQTLTVSE